MESNIRAFNINFKGLNKDFIFSLMETEEEFNIVTTVNAEFIVLANENVRFQKILNDNISTIDGQIPFFFLKLKYPNKKFEKLSGSDLIFYICEKASKSGQKVFLLGGLEISNETARQKLKKLYPGLLIEGYSPPFSPYPFSKELNEKILDILKRFSPDILFVAFGAPKQEYWIEDHKLFLKKIGVRLAIGVGGTFELVAGIEKRAPKFIQTLGLESLWRLYQNPKRFKRFVRNFKFFKYIFS